MIVVCGGHADPNPIFTEVNCPLIGLDPIHRLSIRLHLLRSRQNHSSKLGYRLEGKATRDGIEQISSPRSRCRPTSNPRQKTPYIKSQSKTYPLKNIIMHTMAEFMSNKEFAYFLFSWLR